MVGQRVAEARAYFPSKDDADSTAAEVRAEGLVATVGRAAFGDMWAVTVEGDPAAVLAWSERLTALIRDSE
jgi:hypothetical protein